MSFPSTRLRRLRRTPALRGLVRETSLSPADLIQPLFVTAGTDLREPVESMPGVNRFSITALVEEAGVHGMMHRQFAEPVMDGDTIAGSTWSAPWPGDPWAWR